jgi:hypothetical protein
MVFCGGREMDFNAPAGQRRHTFVSSRRLSSRRRLGRSRSWLGLNITRFPALPQRTSVCDRRMDVGRQAAAYIIRNIGARRFADVNHDVSTIDIDAIASLVGLATGEVATLSLLPK